MHGTRYAEALEIEVFRESGWYRTSGSSPAQPYGISTPLLYACLRLRNEQLGLLAEVDALRAEVRRLEHDLQRTTEERDMLRSGHRVLSTTLGAQRHNSVQDFKSRRAARAHNNAQMHSLS